jgi:hypothetical protein
VSGKSPGPLSDDGGRVEAASFGERWRDWTRARVEPICGLRSRPRARWLRSPIWTSPGGQDGSPFDSWRSPCQPSGDAEQEYFTDGMTEALIAAFEVSLCVISRTSAMRYGTRINPCGDRPGLDVDAVVEGSICARESSANHRSVDRGRDRPSLGGDYEQELEMSSPCRARSRAPSRRKCGTR